MTKSTPVASDNVEVNEQEQPSSEQILGDQSIKGRAVFATEITASGVAVSTAFLAEDGRVFALPAVFPDLQYALSQIDELRQMVMNQFSQMAQVGGQVIAAEMAARANTSQELNEPKEEAAKDKAERGKKLN